MVRLGGHYYDAYNKQNPAGLANDAGGAHTNAKCNGSGRMIANKVIEAGEEIYWCYGNAYWRVWGPRAVLPAKQASAARRATGGRLKAVGVVQRPARRGATGLGEGRRSTRRQTSMVEQAAQSEVGRERMGRVADRVKERRARKREDGPAAEDAPT